MNRHSILAAIRPVQAFAALAALVLCTLSSVARAQVFVEQPLDAALAKATSSNKLLLVVASPNRDRQKITDAVWSNPLLRRWSAQHALVVNITDMETYKTLTQSGLTLPRSAEPLAFRSGKLTRVFGSKLNKDGQPVPSNRETKSELSLPLRLQWTLDGLREKDPAWFDAHTQASPPPAPVERTFISATSDEGADALADAAGADVRSLIVERYQQAKEAAGKGELRRATGLLTWLWERSASTDPAYDSARLYIIAPAMRAVVEKHPPALARFGRVRKSELASLDITGLRELCAYLTLTRVTGVQVEAFDVIDEALNDPDSALMMPRCDRAAWELVLPRLHFGDPTANVNDPLVWLNRLAQRHATPDAKWTPAQVKRWQDFSAWLLRVECARVHAALLAKGLNDQAKDVAQLLLKSENTALARRSLVASAVLIGKVTPDHLVWLTEASDRGEDDPALRRHVQRLLKPE